MKFKFRNPKKSSGKGISGLVRRGLIFGTVALAALILLDALYLWFKWPDWQHYAGGPIQKSGFIERYEKERENNKDWPALRWRPVALNAIPKHVIRAVIVAEDARFYQHDGFDVDAFQDAMEHNMAKQRMVYGGSTISQQTTKNMFLGPSRNPLRKWHEIVLTYGMEKYLQKRRIIEMYLNIAEFGRGVYGVEAAAQYYWGKPIGAVTEDEAVELATTLPAPVNHNPKTRTRFFLRHKRTIARHMAVGHPQAPAPIPPPRTPPAVDLVPEPSPAPLPEPAPAVLPDPVPDAIPESVPETTPDATPDSAADPMASPATDPPTPPP